MEPWMERFEAMIEDYTGEDPLDIWLSYLWQLERHGDQRLVANLLISILQKFWSDYRYRQDPRFIRCCLKRARFVDDAGEFFECLNSQRIGTKTLMLYMDWAEHLRGQGNVLGAHAVLQMGIWNGAEPAEVLRGRLRLLQGFLPQIQSSDQAEVLQPRDSQPFTEMPSPRGVHRDAQETSREVMENWIDQFEETVVDDYIGEDPLDLWLSYLEQQHGEFYSMVVACIVDDFWWDQRYCQDPRFIDCCLKRARFVGDEDDAGDASEFFESLNRQRIGTKTAILYMDWAEHLRGHGNVLGAHAVLQMGIWNGAEPAEDLREQLRLLQDFLTQIQSSDQAEVLQPRDSQPEMPSSDDPACVDQNEGAASSEPQPATSQELTHSSLDDSELSKKVAELARLKAEYLRNQKEMEDTEREYLKRKEKDRMELQEMEERMTRLQISFGDSPLEAPPSPSVLSPPMVCSEDPAPAQEQAASYHHGEEPQPSAASGALPSPAMASDQQDEETGKRSK